MKAYDELISLAVDEKQARALRKWFNDWVELFYAQNAISDAESSQLKDSPYQYRQLIELRERQRAAEIGKAVEDIIETTVQEMNPFTGEDWDNVGPVEVRYTSRAFLVRPERREP